jgi:hypothetical protein
VLHFLRQFASFEAVSTGGEAKYAIIAVVSLLAGPGYLTALVTARGGRARELSHEGIVPPELWLWSPEWLLLSVSLVAVAALVAIQWRSFVLGGRDYRILGVLPLRRRTVMSAKLQSLVAVVLLLHVAINALPGLWFRRVALGWFRGGSRSRSRCDADGLRSLRDRRTAGVVSPDLPDCLARRVSSGVQGAILPRGGPLRGRGGHLAPAYAAARQPAPGELDVPVVCSARSTQLLG